MTDIVRFTTIGQPVAKGSMTAFPRPGGRVSVTNSNVNTKAWQQLIAVAAGTAMADRAPFDEAVHVDLTFSLAKPKSAPKKRTHPTGRPDIDKLARCALDALSTVVFTDDALVCELDVTKGYAVGRPPGVLVVVSPIARPVPPSKTLDV